MSWRGECSTPSGETNFTGNTASPASFVHFSPRSDIAPSRNPIPKSQPPISTGVDLPVPSRNDSSSRVHLWRRPLLRTGGAALALAGAIAGLSATEPTSTATFATAIRKSR